ncbi:MAG: hypothetical protein ACU88J_05640 [Gammaproteobacteria bacterium]
MNDSNDAPPIVGTSYGPYRKRSLPSCSVFPCEAKLPDSIAVAENRIAGGVVEGTGAIQFPQPDPGYELDL